MKKYHVYGLGNALVDTEIKVADEDLDNLGIEKGLMTLVDEERQHFLIDNTQDHLTLSKRACGGSAANTLFLFPSSAARAIWPAKLPTMTMADSICKT